jgi:pimeloyl-ACP methyl ester carboxylesterase
VRANDIDIYYEVQGAGEPVVLIPYLAADQACYAFQVAEYAKQFSCFTVDLRGAGLSGKPAGIYTTELLADDIAAFMQAAGVAQAHVFGLSLGAAAGMWLAAKYPALVKSLSLHSAWPSTDPFLRVVVEGWRIIAQALDSVTDMVIKGIFLVLYPGAVRGPARIRRLARRLRAQPADAAGGCLPPPIGGGPGSRRTRGARLDPGADPDHLRCA